MKKNPYFLIGAPYLSILLVAFLILSPLSHPWFPQTVDGEYYTARLANYVIALREGSIPPRLAPTFYSGLSYAVLNFNYPLPNIMGSLFVFLGFTLQSTMKIMVAGSYLSGGIGVYCLLKKILKSKLSGLVGSLLYLTAPYQLFDIFHRLSIGEIIMFGFLPWILLTLEGVGKGRVSPKIGALAYASFFLTHNLFTLISLPFIGLYGYAYLGKEAMKKNLGALACGLGMSLFFWIPALGEMKETVLPTASINSAFANELLSVNQMLKLPGQYQETLPSTSNTDQPGYAHVSILILTVLFLYNKKSIMHPTSAIKYPVIIALMTGIGVLFMVTIHSRVVWETLPFLRFLQHPTRLYFLWVGATSFLGAVIVKNTKWRWWVSTILVGLTLVNYSQFEYKPKHFVPFEDGFFYGYPLTSAAGNEFDPIWYDRLKADAFLAEHQAEVITEMPVKTTGYSSEYFSRKYTIEAENPTSVIERTLFFPGWETRVNGRLIDTRATASRYFGLVNFDIEAGRHEIETTWTQNTPYRQWGNGLSIVGLVGTLLLKKKKNI